MSAICTRRGLQELTATQWADQGGRVITTTYGRPCCPVLCCAMLQPVCCASSPVTTVLPLFTHGKQASMTMPATQDSSSAWCAVSATATASPRGLWCALLAGTCSLRASLCLRTPGSSSCTVTGLLFEGDDGDNSCQGDGAAAAAGAGRGTADKLGKAVTGGWVLSAGFV